MSHSLKPLQQAGLLTEDGASRLEPVAARYHVALSPALTDLIGEAPDGPVARQYMPDIRELETTPVERLDPIGDGAHSPVKGIVHRYPNRVLFMPIDLCAVYCRFCFRREKVGPSLGHGPLPQADTDRALDYIRGTPVIREVILTGGDPLILSERRLGALLQALEDIPHIRIIRIHSRLPIAHPAGLSDGLYAVLAACTKPLYVALHVNHIDEMTEDVDRAVYRLRRTGCILVSQSVLLKGVNDDVQTLAALFQGLVERGIKPYYLHHPDLAPGTGHFRLSPEKGQALVQAVRGLVSGLAMPTYVLDIPGGFGKVPIAGSHLRGTDRDGYAVLDRDGVLHAYDPGIGDKEGP